MRSAVFVQWNIPQTYGTITLQWMIYQNQWKSCRRMENRHSLVMNALSFLKLRDEWVQYRIGLYALNSVSARRLTEVPVSSYKERK